MVAVEAQNEAQKTVVTAIAPKKTASRCAEKGALGAPFFYRRRGFLCGRHLVQGDVSLLLFDVTTLYFESFEEGEDGPLPDSDEGPRHDQETSRDREDREERAEAFPRDPDLSYRGLRKKGYSKDDKVNET